MVAWAGGVKWTVVGVWRLNQLHVVVRKERLARLPLAFLITCSLRFVQHHGMYVQT